MGMKIEFPEETDDPCVVCGRPMELDEIAEEEPRCWRLVSRQPVEWVCSEKCERVYRRLNSRAG
jgi:predicted nucleic acid-binding Zn ribbon protein